MTRKAPEDKDLTFLLSDDLRPELNGKATILGLFTGRNIIFYAKKDEPLQLGSLAFLGMFFGGKGTYKVTAKVVEPDGKTLLEANLGETEFNENYAANLALKVVPFTGKLGTYRILFTLDDGTTYVRSFDVLRHDPPATAKAAKA